MISKTIRYNGVHNIFRQTHLPTWPAAITTFYRMWCAPNAINNYHDWGWFQSHRNSDFENGWWHWVHTTLPNIVTPSYPGNWRLRYWNAMAELLEIYPLVSSHVFFAVIYIAGTCRNSWFTMIYLSKMVVVHRFFMFFVNVSRGYDPSFRGDAWLRSTSCASGLGLKWSEKKGIFGWTGDDPQIFVTRKRGI